MKNVRTIALGLLCASLFAVTAAAKDAVPTPASVPPMPSAPPAPPVPPPQSSPPASMPPAPWPTADTSIDPKSLAAAREIVKNFETKNQEQAMVGMMAVPILPMVQQENQGQADKIQKIVAGAVQKTLDAHMDDIEKSRAAIYAQLFTLQELQELKSFYQTPAGQKLIQKAPEIMQRSAVIDQTVAMAAMQETHKQIMQDFKKNDIKLPKGMDYDK